MHTFLAKVSLHQNRFHHLFQVWPILQERCFGTFEGRTFKEFGIDAKQNGNLSEGQEPWEHTPEGGETIAQCRTRAAKALEVGLLKLHCVMGTNRCVFIVFIARIF